MSSFRPLSEADLPRLDGLAPFLRPPVADGFAVDADGELAAAGWLRDAQGAEGLRMILDGGVAPAHRGRGYGAALLDQLEAEARRRAGGRVGVIRIEVQDPGEDARSLYGARGFELAVQEQEMERRAEPAAVPAPPGAALETFRAELAGDYHGVYWDAFRERPGFPGWDQETWTKAFAGFPEFRADFSPLLRIDGSPAAYVVGGVEAPHGLIVQMGVRPEFRGRGLGEFLLRFMLDAYARAGLATCRLDVATNNVTAMRLYRRLGFAPFRTVEVWRKAL